MGRETTSDGEEKEESQTARLFKRSPILQVEMCFEVYILAGGLLVLYMGMAHTHRL